MHLSITCDLYGLNNAMTVVNGPKMLHPVFNFTVKYTNNVKAKGWLEENFNILLDLFLWKLYGMFLLRRSQTFCMCVLLSKCMDYTCVLYKYIGFTNRNKTLYNA